MEYVEYIIEHGINTKYNIEQSICRICIKHNRIWKQNQDRMKKEYRIEKTTTGDIAFEPAIFFEVAWGRRQKRKIGLGSVSRSLKRMHSSRQLSMQPPSRGGKKKMPIAMLSSLTILAIMCGFIVTSENTSARPQCFLYCTCRILYPFFN